jgi:PhoH-like ATPase
MTPSTRSPQKARKLSPKAAPKAKKLFVLDTNVILYDYRCIYSFEENDVVIPITVLEEIDKFKRGNEMINYNAREFSRELDALGTGDALLDQGIRLASGGTILVSTKVSRNHEIADIFWEDKPDHRILAVAYNLAALGHYRGVILVSKDINLRMKAKSIGLHAEATRPARSRISTSCTRGGTSSRA